MRQPVVPVLVLVLVLVLVALLAAPASRAGTGGAVSGRVTTKSGGKAPTRTVVYLEWPAGIPAPASAWAPRPPIEVRQKDAKFSPDFVVVVQGSAIRFVNDESADIDHNVYSFSRSNKFDLGICPRGSTKEVLFPECGRATVFCSIHKYMEMAVVVVPTPFFAVADAEGRFSIEGVPGAKWVLKTSQASPRWREASVEVEVGDKPVTQDLVLTR